MIGQVLLERFTIQEQLGEGGMGVVYRAIDDRGQPVAIKRLHASVAQSPDLAARFEREAQAHAMLSHPNIIGLQAVGLTDDGGMFFVLEYVHGHELADELDHGPIALPRALALGKQVLSGLHHAHQFGLVHRDLKPENVLIARTQSGDQVKLIDFGLVKMLSDVLGAEETQRLTRTGVIFGTPDYMAPEQMLGAEVDARTDLYAFGVVLFEMLTGRRPFEAEEVTQLWQAHIHAPVPTLASKGGPANDDLDAIIAMLMAKQRGDRFATAMAARRALDSVGL